MRICPSKSLAIELLRKCAEELFLFGLRVQKTGILRPRYRRYNVISAVSIAVDAFMGLGLEEYLEIKSVYGFEEEAGLLPEFLR